MNIVACGGTFDRTVRLDVGRVHYDLIRYVGTCGSDIAEGYSWIPETCELRDGDHVAVIGAAGPMGLMHAVRTATCGRPGVTLATVDVDDARLTGLHGVLEPIASQAGIPTQIINSAITPLAQSTYTYIALMVPAPALLQQALDIAAEGAIVNAFAGFAIGTMADVDISALLGQKRYLVGTSGSRIQDMKTVWGRMDQGIVDTTISLDAISGMAGVEAAIESVNNRTSQGKIMVFPWMHDLGLIRLQDLPNVLPDVAAAMADGRWTKAAEEALATHKD